MHEALPGGESGIGQRRVATGALGMGFATGSGAALAPPKIVSNNPLNNPRSEARTIVAALVAPIPISKPRTAVTSKRRRGI
ncbi:hypothetical protein GCM10025880_60380 [Methylorubrum aminovorans]|nr:hypothetical protein GCM10025880_60380 [Methylorubrum aminovorans]